MRIAALSDFHIGADRRADQFGHDEPGFLGFLDQLEAEHDHIVLVGDIFQTQHSLGVGRRAALQELDRARARLPQLSHRIAQEPYLYVHGNHDEVAREALGARESLRLESDGFAVYFIHGHQIDPILRRAYPLARLGTWLTGRMRHCGLGAVAELLEHRDITIKHSRFGGIDGPYATAARALLREHRADAVIMGHTHVAGRHEVAEGIAANTGSCSARQRVYISIDTERRTVELVRP